VLAALLFFTARDDATTSVPEAAAPGQPFRGAAPLPADLRRGNVVVVADAGNALGAKQVAADVAGPADPALRAAGQAVRVQRSRRAGVTAYAEGRALTVSSAADPQLRAFLEYWLGRAAG
jgi:hypothetical protein